MILYQRERHEHLLVAFYFELKRDPVELADLFMQPLQNLTNFLWWAEHTVKFMFAKDAQGIWAAAWVEPIMSGAFFGTWIRKEKRKGVGQYAFVNHCINVSLDTFPILIALTQRRELDTIMRRLGFEGGEEYPHLFAGNTALAYKLTTETRRNRYGWKRRRQEHIDGNIEQPLRADAGEVREVGAADIPAVEHADRGSVADGGRERGDTDNQPEPRRRTRRRIYVVGEHEAGAGAGGTVENLVRAGDNGRQ